MEGELGLWVGQITFRQMMPLLQGDDFSYQFYRICPPQNPNSPCKVTVNKSVIRQRIFFSLQQTFFFMKEQLNCWRTISSGGKHDDYDWRGKENYNSRSSNKHINDCANGGVWANSITKIYFDYSSSRHSRTSNPLEVLCLSSVSLFVCLDICVIYTKLRSPPPLPHLWWTGCQRRAASRLGCGVASTILFLPGMMQAGLLHLRCSLSLSLHLSVFMYIYILANMPKSTISALYQTRQVVLRVVPKLQNNDFSPYSDVTVTKAYDTETMVSYTGIQRQAPVY